MAVTRRENVIRMTADADEQTGHLVVQAIRATGEVALVTQSDSDLIVAAFPAAGQIEFPCPLMLDGIARTTGDGHLWVYLK